MNRILIVGPKKSGKLTLLKKLTGSLPDIGDSHAGLTHSLEIENKYFSTTISIWIDEYHDIPDFVNAYSTPEGQEVLECVGVICLCLPYIPPRLTGLEVGDKTGLIIHKTRAHSHEKQMAEEKREGIEGIDGWEGWERIFLDEEGVNEYNEKLGVERVREVIESHPWPQSSKPASTHPHSSPSMSDLGQEDNDGNENMADLDILVERLKATREFIATLPENEREEYAKRMVEELI